MSKAIDEAAGALLMGGVDIRPGLTSYAIGRTYRDYLYMVGLGAGRFMPVDDMPGTNPFDRENSPKWDVHLLTGYDSFRGHGVMEVLFDRNGLAAFRDNYTFFYRPDLSERKVDAISGNRDLKMSKPLFLDDQVTVENAWRLLKSGNVEDRIAGVGMMSYLPDNLESREMVRFIHRDESVEVRRRLVDRLWRASIPADVYASMLSGDPDERIRERAANMLCHVYGGTEPFIETISRDPCPMTRASGLLLQKTYDSQWHIDYFLGDTDRLVRCAAAWTWSYASHDEDLAFRLVIDDPLVFKYMCSKMYAEPGPYTCLMNEFMKRTKSDEIRAEAAMGLLGAWQ